MSVSPAFRYIRCDGTRCGEVFQVDGAHQSARVQRSCFSGDGWHRWRGLGLCGDCWPNRQAVVGRCSPMADDPRIEPTAKTWRALEPTETGRTVEQFIAELLLAADSADPLRALLADEDRAVDLIARVIHADWAGDSAHLESSVYHKRYASAGLAVLAALREGAGNG